ncbi:dehydratase [Gordonia desulfuricans]|uniref:Dehydratase n=1 Tax=Gordonia desulfuricans TaxID=89051 RepID=A0A7K3LT38_9ACTN|nr:MULTISPECIES: MaoC/PaaZ C-terminal domain-containing protein [Gordonia]EMP14391.1 dehydratase [Gordonia sp. NB41Y]NDK91171.1 dehydratase [Gordonia desulfuricans]WLP90846.1 MaoC/PaaZ C-terminal domain-containing protein [Gordonia sp. NB41Y]
MGEIIYADDLRVGEVHDLGPHTVGEAELVEFASAWDPQSFHVDKADAEAGAFRGLIASGIHTLAIAQRLSVTQVIDSWSVIAGRRLREITFTAPVRPDDTLTGSLRVDAVELDERRGRALITYAIDLRNQRGIDVMHADVEAYVRTRPAGTD